MKLKWPLPPLWTHQQPTATEMKQQVTDPLNDLFGYVVPSGMVLPFGGPVANLPTGWLYCNGQTAPRYQSDGITPTDLFAAIGTAHGPGDGLTTFNVPDLRGHFPIGTGASYPLGGIGGSANHTHPFDAGAHTHAIAVVLEKDTTTAQGGSGSGPVLTNATTLAGNTSMGAVDVSGTTSGPNDLPVPWVGLNFVIKT